MSVCVTGHRVQGAPRQTGVLTGKASEKKDKGVPLLT